jgi:L-rhamnose mutarotase
MKYFGMALDLKDDLDLIQRYKAYHRAPWPEPLAGLAEVGVKEMKIFLLGQRLFMYMETVDDFDIETAFSAYADATPRAAEWDALMRTMQQPAPGAGQGEWWAMMEPLFDLQAPDMQDLVNGTEAAED